MSDEVEEVVSVGRVLLIETRNEKLRVTLPEGARVTFGPLVPASGKARGFGGADESGGTALRIYRGANKEDQIAVFRDVRCFRDEALLVEKEVVDEKVEVEVARDGKSTKIRNAEARVKKWVTA